MPKKAKSAFYILAFMPISLSEAQINFSYCYNYYELKVLTSSKNSCNNPNFPFMSLSNNIMFSFLPYVTHVFLRAIVSKEFYQKVFPFCMSMPSDVLFDQIKS